MVSIIVPVYNAENFLEKCVSSVLNQSYKDFELVLVDDGSADSSSVICKNFAKNDSRIVFIHQDNSGVSAARNSGLKAAKGEFIAFVDSDDYVEKDWLKLLVDEITASNADVAVCGIKLENGERNISCAENIVWKKDNLTAALQERGLLYPVFNKLYRRELISAGFKVGMKFGEDLLFNLEYFQNINKIAVVSRALYFYRKDNPMSATSNFRADKFKDIIFLYKQTDEFCEKISDENIRRSMQKHFAAMHVWDYLGNLQRLAEIDNRTYKENYRCFKTALAFVDNKCFFRAGFESLLAAEKKIAAYFAYKGFVNALLCFFKVKIFVKRLRKKAKERIFRK